MWVLRPLHCGCLFSFHDVIAPTWVRWGWWALYLTQRRFEGIHALLHTAPSLQARRSNMEMQRFGVAKTTFPCANAGLPAGVNCCVSGDGPALFWSLLTVGFPRPGARPGHAHVAGRAPLHTSRGRLLTPACLPLSRDRRLRHCVCASLTAGPARGRSLRPG